MAISTSVLSVKLERAFRLLDTDGDGGLVPADFTELASRLALAFQAEGDADKIRRLERALLTFWETDFVGMDADGNGSIDREEYEAGWRTSLAHEGDAFLARFHTIVEAWMDLADTNGNGLIELDEYQRMFHLTMGVPEDDLAIAFQRLDAAGRGYLDKEQIRTYSTEYFTSDDPDSRGNWFFGPIA